MRRANKLFLEFKAKLEKQGEGTYRDISKKAGLTPAGWNQPIVQDEPMTLGRAKRFLNAFDFPDTEKKEFLTVVCAELILSLIDKKNVDLVANPPTAQIAQVIEALEKLANDPNGRIVYVPPSRFSR